LAALIGFDLGSMLGFEGRDGISWEIPQAAKKEVDRILDRERSQAHGAVAHDLDGKLSARYPAELLADDLGNYNLALAGHAGCGVHPLILPGV
jgi:hypothetical protein